ncbi:hypothetical protein C5167_046345 [Papaver somniferum]|uniref:Uncharacterized protein n=1 Tax=Papaver somniferum TaxID=3469 RepID=A0A4Y7LH73_PAPSO|nr:hypothetical protein C5167_046345 [Papaver somniferum]
MAFLCNTTCYWEARIVELPENEDWYYTCKTCNKKIKFEISYYLLERDIYPICVQIMGRLLEYSI